MTDDQDFAELLKKYRKRFDWSQAVLAERVGVHRNTITKLETRERRPNQPEVLQLAREFQLEGEERKEFLIAADLKGNASEEGLWNVPHNQNPFFTGHEEIFPSLWERLAPGRGTRAIAITQALSGLGGIGKTQVAVEYAYRYANKYDAVLWLPADSMETLIAACLQLATNELGLPEQPDANRQVEAVKEWFRTHQKWLLILDNVENPQEILSVLVPGRHKGSVLITTRMREVGKLARMVELPLLSPDDAVLFLLRRAGRIAQDAPIETAVPYDRLVASILCKLMDRLPLALDQAGAYIAENGSSLEQYLDLYHQCRQELLDRRRAKDLKQITDHPDSVLMTFWLSWEQVHQRNAIAGMALQFCAFLAPDQIPEGLVQAGILQLEVESPQKVLEIDEALGLLHRYSLIERRKPTLSLHRLVQEVMQEVLSEKEGQQWMERAVQVVNAVFPSGEHGTWSLCEFLLPHALTCAKWTSLLRRMKPEGARLLSVTGRYLYERAQYKEAEPLLKRALATSEEQLGASHPQTSASLNCLAMLYKTQGKYVEAEPLYRRALAINEEQLGGTHPNTAINLNNLAMLYKVQGKYAEAEPLLRRALLIREQQLGGTHPDTAISLNNLAMLYTTQGKYAEAALLYRQALEIYEKQFGGIHPDTATSLNNLAYLYEAQGKYAEAEPLYRRALLIREQQLGAHHPDTARSLNNLAMPCYRQGRYTEAEQLSQRALAIQEEQLGASHPDTATSLNNLALLYESQARYTEAEPLYQRAFSIVLPSFGMEHPQTQQIAANYFAFLADRYMNGDMDAFLRLLSQREQENHDGKEALPE